MLLVAPRGSTSRDRGQGGDHGRRRARVSGAGGGDRRAEPRHPQRHLQGSRGHRPLVIRGGARVDLPTVLLRARAQTAVGGGRDSARARARLDLPGHGGARADVKRSGWEPVRDSGERVPPKDLVRWRLAAGRVPVCRRARRATRCPAAVELGSVRTARATQVARFPVRQPHQRAVAPSNRRGVSVCLCGSDGHHAREPPEGEIPRARDSCHNHRSGLRRYEVRRVQDTGAI